MAFTKEKTKEMFNEFVNAYSDAKSKSYAYFRLIENVELTFYIEGEGEIFCGSING